MKDIFSFSEMSKVEKSLTDSQRIIKEASSLEWKNVFLSYCSDDEDIVWYVYDLLHNNGGRVYLDKFDKHLSQNDFVQVAQRLSDAATKCNKMVLLVTKHISRSIWIPWEIGLGHGSHSKENVALFFATESLSDTSWKKQEYLGMYQWIVDPEYVFNSGKYIFDPLQKKVVISLKSWLK